MAFNPAKLRSMLIVGTLSIVLSVIGMIATQDFQIFPGAFHHRHEQSRDPKDLPKKVESVFVDTSDGKKLEVWRLPAVGRKQVAIIFHGNGGSVVDFYGFQEFFAKLGITSYGFDYRGYGRSSGWPSERGLYIDSETVTNYVLGREAISPEDLIVAGVSLGGGPASYVGVGYEPKALVLFSAFTSLVDVISERPILGLLSPFSFYRFPVKENIARLSKSCLILAHGMRDNVIPWQHAPVLQSAYTGSGLLKLITSEGAGHNDILDAVGAEVGAALMECLGSPLDSATANGTQ